MPKGILSQSTKLYVSDGNSPSTFTAVGNITDISGPNGSLPTEDASNLDSAAVERIAGLPDEGEVTFEINYDPDNANHTVLRNARRAGTRLEFKITFADATPTTLLFFGFVTRFQPKASKGRIFTASLALAIDGTVTEA